MDKNGNSIILGLDVSTTTIGVCILLDDGTDYGKILELTHVSPQVSKSMGKTESLFAKKDVFRTFIRKFNNLGIDYVVIEEPLLSSQNVNTVATLLRFNALISNVIYEEMRIVPEYISSMDARTHCFPTLISPRKYGVDEKIYQKDKILKEIKEDKYVLFGANPWSSDKKTILQGMVAEIFPQIEWLYNSKGQLKKENFDSSDAYIAACGFARMKKYGKPILKHSNLVVEENKATYDVEYWDKKEHRTTYFQ